MSISQEEWDSLIDEFIKSGKQAAFDLLAKIRKRREERSQKGDEASGYAQMVGLLKRAAKDTDWFHWKISDSNHFVARSKISRISVTKRKEWMALDGEINESNRDCMVITLQLSGDHDGSTLIYHPDDVRRFMDWIGLPLPSKGTK